MFAVESNIVGYQNKDVGSGLTSQIPTFESVGGTGGSKLSDFVVVDSTGQKVSNAFTVQFYSKLGKLEESYHFCKEGEAGWGDLPEGWFDGDEEEVKDKDIDFGKGFYAYATAAGSKLSYAGQVDTRETAIPVENGGLSSMGNIRPAGIKLSDLKVVDENDQEVSNALTIQFYGSSGTLIGAYHYCKEGEAGWGDLPAGWFDGDEEEVKDRDLDASEGFTVFANGSKQVYLKFPAL